MRRTFELGLVLALGLVILAWGTSPCLFAAMLSADGGSAEVADCGCGCCAEAETPAPDAPGSGSDECPVCSSVGNMHELVPPGAKIVLVAPTASPFLALRPSPTATPDATPLADATLLALEPPRVQFCTTVALLR